MTGGGGGEQEWSRRRAHGLAALGGWGETGHSGGQDDKGAAWPRSQPFSGPGSRVVAPAFPRDGHRRAKNEDVGQGSEGCASFAEAAAGGQGKAGPVLLCLWRQAPGRPQAPRSGGVSALGSFSERVLSLAPRSAAWNGLALGDMVQQAGNSVVHAQNSPPSHGMQGPVLCTSWGLTLLSGVSTGTPIEGKNRVGWGGDSLGSKACATDHILTTHESPSGSLGSSC